MQQTNDRKYLTISNILTIIRLVGSLLLPLVFFMTPRGVFLGYLIFLSLTDFADGLLARKLGQTTRFGEFLDPISDRFLAGMFALTIFFSSLVPWLIIVLTLSRELICLPILLYARYQKKRFLPSTGSVLGKITTAIQFVTFVFMVLIPDSLFTISLAAVTGAFGVLSAFLYAYKTWDMKFLER